MTERPEALLVMADATLRRLFDQQRLTRLAELTSLVSPVHVTELVSAAAVNRLAAAEVLITSWGCPPLAADILRRAPRLRAVFHAAGSVKEHITPACWERGLIVTSAAHANAIPVAEYTLAAILFAGKRAATFAALYRTHAGTWAPWRDAVSTPSNYRRTVGVIGLSQIGRRVAALLRPFDLSVIAVDPYATAAEAASYGATLVDLEELLSRSDIVTLHAPALPETQHLLDGRRLALLRDGATLINTARGSLVDTAALTAECVSGRLAAVLDVTEPEPLPADSALYRLPNVVLTPHIAGALATETYRLTDSALREVERYVSGVPLHHVVTNGDLARIA